MITNTYCELQPAYGRDYKTKKEVEQAFREGKDFEGDYQLGFKLCSIHDFASGTPVLLRYKNKRSVVQVNV